MADLIERAKAAYEAREERRAEEEARRRTGRVCSQRLTEIWGRLAAIGIARADYDAEARVEWLDVRGIPCIPILHLAGLRFEPLLSDLGEVCALAVRRVCLRCGALSGCKPVKELADLYEVSQYPCPRCQPDVPGAPDDVPF